jgi:deoxyribodipyrimidine photo-lyase
MHSPAGEGIARLRDYSVEQPENGAPQQTRDGISSEYHRNSPWLATGCLSPRRVVAEPRRHEAQYGAPNQRPVGWNCSGASFFRWTMVRYGSALFKAQGLKPPRGHRKKLDERFTHCHGRTGMPMVDANMRELATGFGV